jgi:hypothetical protein
VELDAEGARGVEELGEEGERAAEEMIEGVIVGAADPAR